MTGWYALNTSIMKDIGCIRTTNFGNMDQVIITLKKSFVSVLMFFNFIQSSPFRASDSANDMNTNAYKAAIHKVHERTIYESTNALPFYVRECGGGWACLESRHKDWRFYYLAINTRLTEPEVVLQWSLNPEVSGTMMHKIECTDCNSLKKCHIIHQTGMKVSPRWVSDDAA